MDRTVWFRVAFRFSIIIGGTIILESQVPISMYCIWKHCTQQLFSLRESCLLQTLLDYNPLSLSFPINSWSPSAGQEGHSQLLRE